MKVGIVMSTNASSLRALVGDPNAVSTAPDDIRTPPDLVGDRGRAWLVDAAAAVRRAGKDPDDDATIAYWLVEAPWAHPCWHSYAIICVHQRPLERLKDSPPKFYLDGATHELWVFAVDPDKDRNAMMVECSSAGWLHPKNFAAQFIEITDDLARERVKGAVRDVIAGQLSPDVDAQRAWANRFGWNMVKPEYRGQ